MTYNLVYNEQRKIVWLLIIVPITWSAIFISLILAINDMPGWLPIVGSVLLIAVSTFNVLYVLKRWLSIDTTVEVTDDYFHYKMAKKSPLYKHSEIKVSWDHVRNFSGDDINDASFAVFKLSKPNVKFSLSPPVLPEAKKPFKDFVSEVSKKIESYNEQAREKHLQVITHKSVFESTGARIGAVLFTALLVVLTVAFKTIPTDHETFNWWRLAWLWLASAPYLIAVFGSWKKKD